MVLQLLMCNVHPRFPCKCGQKFQVFVKLCKLTGWLEDQFLFASCHQSSLKSVGGVGWQQE